MSVLLVTENGIKNFLIKAKNVLNDFNENFSISKSLESSALSENL